MLEKVPRTDDRILRFLAAVALMLAGYGLVHLSVTEHTLLPPLTEARSTWPQVRAPETGLGFQLSHPVRVGDLSAAVARRLEAGGGRILEYGPEEGRVVAAVPASLVRELEWAETASWSELKSYLAQDAASAGDGERALVRVVAEPGMVQVLGTPVRWWALALPGGLMCVVAGWFLGAWLFDSLPSRNRTNHILM